MARAGGGHRGVHYVDPAVVGGNAQRQVGGLVGIGGVGVGVRRNKVQEQIPSIETIVPCHLTKDAAYMRNEHGTACESFPVPYATRYLDVAHEYDATAPPRRATAVTSCREHDEGASKGRREATQSPSRTVRRPRPAGPPAFLS